MDDRERSFEKGLARRLRAEALRSACPDAEILAAYHERSLLPDELNSWKSHIASCGDCQEILAQLEATENIPLAPQAEPGAAEGSKFFDAVLTQETTTPAAKQAASAVREIRRPPRAAYWRWIAPAGAIAAALLIWVALHETRPPLSNASKIEMAKNVPEPPPTQTAMSPATSAERETREPEAASKAAAPADRLDLGTRDAQNRTDVLQKKTPAPPVLGRQAGIAGYDARVVPPPPPPAPLPDNLTAENQPAGGSVGGVVAGTGSATATARAKEKKPDGLADQDQTMNYMSGAPSPAAAAPATRPAPAEPSENAKDAKDKETVQAQAQTVQVETSPAAAPTEETKQNAQAATDLNKIQSMTETVEVAPTAQAAPGLLPTKGRLSRLIRAPGGKVVWRLGMYGHIEQSTDSGKTWTLQNSGTTENLYLGSAPSEQVCWVISMGGVILRTTDSGAHWLPVISPIPQQQLSLIRASDDLHATVWDYSRRRSFQTSDGGATWTQATNR